MERLTTKNIAGVAVYKHPFECERCGETIWRLPDYGDGSPTEKLADYEDAEEKGLLLRLPCKPKSEVFLICSRYTRCSFEDVPFEESSCIGCENDYDSHKEIYIHRNSSVDVEWIVRNLNKFGKTVFLTKEEAEQKLKEMSK